MVVVVVLHVTATRYIGAGAMMRWVKSGMDEGHSGERSARTCSRANMTRVTRRHSRS